MRHFSTFSGRNVVDRAPFMAVYTWALANGRIISANDTFAGSIPLCDHSSLAELKLRSSPKNVATVWAISKSVSDTLELDSDQAQYVTSFLLGTGSGMSLSYGRFTPAEERVLTDLRAWLYGMSVNAKTAKAFLHVNLNSGKTALFTSKR